MFSTEQYQQHHLFQQPFGLELGSIDSNPSATMEGYTYMTAFNNDLPFGFCDLPETSMDAPFDAYRYDMARTPSNNSMRHHEFPPALLPSGSIGSTSSSTVGSPHSGLAHTVPAHDSYQMTSRNYLASPPAIVTCDDGYQHDYVSGHDMSYSDQDRKLAISYPTGVDPNMLQSSMDLNFTQHQLNSTGYSYNTYAPSTAPSPAPSHHSYAASTTIIPADVYNQQARPERGNSVFSNRSSSPRTPLSSDEDSAEKGRCSHPDCGRIVKDLKSHMLTHQSERPEKCPIVTCDFHTKGFARKYDRNRHVLTHYKGTMICGFCPGSGSPAEKTFNRADVFKRHLTTVHGVEQNPPNSRKRSPNGSSKKLSSYCQDATGKCSTCSGTFSNAQEFYEHLDGCVLAIVQQVEPSEAINAQRLAEVSKDAAVLETFERNMIKNEDVSTLDDEDEEDEDDEADEDEDDDEEDDEITHDSFNRATFKSSKLSGHRAVIGGNISKSKSGKKGMTWSKIGVSLAGKGRKRRKHYPPSWGMSADKMKMKKRVLCVYDGNHRLVKDDMMLNNEFEVRVRLADGNNYVTDLDIETVKRANAYHEAPDAEKAPWIPEQDFFTDLLS